LELRVDDEVVAHWNIGLGDFSLSAPVANGSGERRVTLAFAHVQQLPNGDGRMVGARLSFIGFEPGRAASQDPKDIVRGTHMELGAGWGVLETFHGETFRWVENDAQITLTARQPGGLVLSMIAEPGPGVNSRPFLLKVIDAGGREVSTATVKERGEVKLTLPPLENAQTFRLHIDGGGQRVPHDPRVLNFRVFEITAQVSKTN
jgi:hypothetical protein